MYPCRCGYLDDAGLACGRAPKCAQEYQSRNSGPLFDRIDCHVDVPAMAPADLTLPPPAGGFGANSGARRRGKGRADGALRQGPPIRTKAEADGELLERVAAPDAEGRRLLNQAAERFKLSARGYHRVLRVARTIADLDRGDTVHRVHVAEALSYRRIMPKR